MDVGHYILGLVLLLTSAEAFVELPKFNQLLLLYPGYHHYGGAFHTKDLMEVIGGNHTNPLAHIQNSSPLRMSIALNRYGGRHTIGFEPLTDEKGEIVSILGKDNQQYIFPIQAFGPFLANKYGNPVIQKPNKRVPQLTMEPFIGKQGIIRFVSYHTDHAGGHIALWDCDNFFQSPDWSTEHNMISVEFWETPDSYCAPKEDQPDLKELLKFYRLVPKTTDNKHNRQNIRNVRHGKKSQSHHHRLKNPA